MQKQWVSFRAAMCLFAFISGANAHAQGFYRLRNFLGRVTSNVVNVVQNSAIPAPAAPATDAQVASDATASDQPTPDSDALATTSPMPQPTPQPTPANVIPNACSPIGPQRIAVILANYEGSPTDTATPNLNYIRELFLGANSDFSVSDYYKTVSRGRSWFQSVVFLGPYPSPKPFALDTSKSNAIAHGLNQWETDLVALASRDQDFSQIDRVVFITPNAIDLNGASVPMAAGLSTQGVCDLDSVNAQGMHHPLAHSWVLASKNYLGATVDRISTDPSVIAMLDPATIAANLRRFQMLDMAPITHELGHTFGLGHANQVNRPLPNYSNAFMNSEILPGASDTMYENSYADPFSVMGAGEIQWLNVAHLTQLGWLGANQTQEVRVEGTYRIFPLESDAPGGALKGLKIPRVIQSPNESTVSDLWVEYRQRTTVYDTELTAITHSTNGAIVHYTNPNQPGPNSVWPFETVLLNFHPDGQPVNPYEPDLTLTTSWKDAHSMVKLDVVDVTPDYMDIHVSFVP
jgi:hypothetical protein